MLQQKNHVSDHRLATKTGISPTTQRIAAFSENTGKIFTLMENAKTLPFKHLI